MISKLDSFIGNGFPITHSILYSLFLCFFSQLLHSSFAYLGILLVIFDFWSVYWGMPLLTLLLWISWMILLPSNGKSSRGSSFFGSFYYILNRIIYTFKILVIIQLISLYWNTSTRLSIHIQDAVPSPFSKNKCTNPAK